MVLHRFAPYQWCDTVQTPRHSNHVHCCQALLHNEVDAKCQCTSKSIHSHLHPEMHDPLLGNFHPPRFHMQYPECLAQLFLWMVKYWQHSGSGYSYHLSLYAVSKKHMRVGRCIPPGCYQHIGKKECQRVAHQGNQKPSSYVPWSTSGNLRSCLDSPGQSLTHTALVGNRRLFHPPHWGLWSCNPNISLGSS